MGLLVTSSSVCMSHLYEAGRAFCTARRHPNQQPRAAAIARCLTLLEVYQDVPYQPTNGRRAAQSSPGPQPRLAGSLSWMLLWGEEDAGEAETGG